MWVGLLALVTAAAFAGAAVFASVAEEPARLALDDRSALIEWQRSYATASIMQGGMALFSAVLGFVAAGLYGDYRWAFGASLILANWPYVFLAIMPTNKLLHATQPAEANAETRRLMIRWGRLHAGRSALGVAATVAYFWATLAYVR